MDATSLASLQEENATMKAELEKLAATVKEHRFLTLWRFITTWGIMLYVYIQIWAIVKEVLG